MNHFNYQQRLHELWQKAVDLYRGGQRGSETYFNADDVQWLRANGVTPQEIYDFAEDFVSGGEPDFTTFAMITDIRRSFFLDELGGQYTGRTIDPDSYPPKDSEVEGIRWLPRIIAKAKAKLRGELDPDTMYACGGDRAFLRDNDIHPAEFLRKVRDHIDHDEAVIGWVKSRRPG